MPQRQRGSHHGYEHIAQLTEVSIHGHHNTGNAVGIAGRRPQLLVDALKVADGLLLVAERLHDLLPRHHLLDEAVHACQRLLLRAKIAARPLAQPCGCYRHEYGNEDAHQRERNTQHEHRGERHDDGDERVEHLCHTRRDDLPQRVYVVGVGRHHLAVRVGVKVTEWQPLHALEELLAQSQLSALRDVDHQPVIRVGTNHAQQQHESQLQQGLQERGILRIVDLREWYHVVVDECTGEQR